MFQKCPCCGGTGKESPQYTNALPITCTVCKGAKIISQLTGLPPSSINIEENNCPNKGNPCFCDGRCKKKTNFSLFNIAKEDINEFKNIK